MKNLRPAMWAVLHLVPVFFALQISAQNFIPPRSTVILLSGLSGDLPSQNTFQSQLQSWLELLPSLPNPPAQILVFSDNPDSVSLPPNFPARKFKCAREDFLAATKSLAGQTNPLVVIAWGHGGLQGNTPVFHVPGPRITVADFKNLAAEISSDSRWLLYFRGSGKFAAELSAGHRVVIASENETMFNSDPVGLTLFLKALRANPSAPVPALARELGRATAAWYKDRNLVRTEEPTLWNPPAAPQILADSENESATPPSTNTESAAPAQTLSTTNLPAIWKTIVRVEPRDYPDAAGVVLRCRITCALTGSTPAITGENEDFIQVLTAEGKRLGDFDFSYSPPDEDITFLNCEVLLPSGKLLSLDPDEIRDAADNSWGEYRGERRKIFSLPGVVPGAILRVHYQTTWKAFPFPYVSRSLVVASDLPVMDASVEVSVPSQAAFHFALDQLTAADPTVKQTSYGTTYSWQFQNIPAAEREMLSPPFHEPSLLISTFPDWQSFIGWYSRISELADAVTPDIAAKATELTAGESSELSRAKKLFDFVTALRYVAVPLGVNSFRPHAADEVLKHGYGDCKDKANLFNALLHSQKIEAHLVLVPRFTQARDNLPGFAFNHAISQIKIGDQIMFADTTDDVCRFGMLPPGDPGRNVLVFDGKSTSLTQLPQPKPDAHHLTLKAAIDCDAASSDCTAMMDAEAVGFPEYSLRAAAQNLKSESASLPLIAIHYRPAAGIFGLEKQSFSPPASLDQNFDWHATGSFAGILSANGGRRILRAPFWLPKEWDAALNHRKNPLFLNEGYPLVLTEDFDFTLPSASTQITLPASATDSTGPLNWKLEWKNSGATAVSAHLRIELAHGELSVSDTPVFQRQLRQLLSALAAEANFKLSS